ncbi:beta-lactamase/transpeptidase-like protein [Phaeosphaeriaceae sp. PMI808]|nr:beta-lactamase/transpeptidase-like protein [Phaeosphaeriaceae sp. PMI808]
MATLEGNMTESTRGQHADVLGAVAIAVDRNENVILSHVAGKTHLEPQTANPMTIDTIITLASCTKLITAIAALRLVQLGKLDLDDTEVVAQHLPELHEQGIISSASGDTFSITPRKEGITVRHLLTHTSGSGYDLLNPLLQAWRKSRGEQPISLTAALPEAIAMPGLFEPGSGWTYGGGSDWTGLLLSRLANMNLGDLMREEIFDFVGCDARIGFSRQEMEKHGDIVQAVVKSGDGRLVPYPMVDQKSERGGGGLFASARNFSMILQDLIAPESRLLDDGMRDVLFGAQLAHGSDALAQVKESFIVKAMAGPLMSCLAPAGVNYALGGLLVQEDDDDEPGKTKATLVWGGAYGCLWFLNRQKGLAGFYGSSVFSPNGGKSSELMGQFVSDVWARSAL